MSKNLKLLIAFFLAVSCLGVGLRAQEAETVEPGAEEAGKPSWIFKLNGYIKNLAASQMVDSSAGTGDTTRINSDLTRLRLSPEISSPGAELLFHMDADNELVTGNRMRSRDFDLLFRPSAYNDLFHTVWDPVYNNILYRIKIHRLYTKVTKGKFSLTAGRQLVRFGNGRLWNPLDIMNPVSPTAIEGAEELQGTDALRFQYYPLDMMEMSLVLDQKRCSDRIDEIRIRNTNTLARMKATIGNYEIAAIGGWIARRGIGGMDASVLVADGIARGSLLYSNPSDAKYYIQSGLGYEYTFSTGISLIVEYFFNGAALKHCDDVKNSLKDRYLYGVREKNYYMLANQFITLNRHYAGTVAGYDFTALLRGEVFLIWDIEGDGLLALPSLTYNIFQNIDISLSMITGLTGDSGNSDFDVYNRRCAVFGSLVWYF